MVGLNSGEKRLNAWFEAGAKHIDHDCTHGLCSIKVCLSYAIY